MIDARPCVLLMAAALCACSQTAQESPPAADQIDDGGHGTGGTDGGVEASGSSGGSGSGGSPDPAGTDGHADRGGDDAGEEHAPTGGDAAADPLAAADAELERALAKRQARERQRALELATRSSEVDHARGELDRLLASVESLEGRLDRRLGIGKVARQRRQERLAALAALLASMPPQAGAQIVAQMPNADAQDLLLAVAQKNDRRAAKLMSLMPPHRAAALGKRYLDTDPEALKFPASKDAPAPTPSGAPSPAGTAATPPREAAAAPAPEGTPPATKQEERT